MKRIIALLLLLSLLVVCNKQAISDLQTQQVDLAADFEALRKSVKDNAEDVRKWKVQLVPARGIDDEGLLWALNETSYFELFGV